MNRMLMLATVVVLSGCLADGQPVSSPKTPATCADALQKVVQAEQAYDYMLAGADQVRDAVLAANRLCGQ